MNDINSEISCCSCTNSQTLASWWSLEKFKLIKAGEISNLNSLELQDFPVAHLGLPHPKLNNLASGHCVQKNKLSMSLRTKVVFPTKYHNLTIIS